MLELYYSCSIFAASTLVEAVLCETHDDCTVIDLYLTIRNVKVISQHLKHHYVHGHSTAVE